VSCNTKQTKLHLLQSCDLWPIKKTTTTTSIYLFISINCHPSHISPKRDALRPRPAFHAQAIQVVSADRPSASIQGTLRGGQTVGLGVLAVWHWKTWRSGIFWSILCVCIYVCICIYTYIYIYNIYIYWTWRSLICLNHIALRNKEWFNWPTDLEVKHWNKKRDFRIR
jgi:hypothetical protein